MDKVELVGNARVAADLAAAGFSVFPCHAGGAQVKRPMPGVFWRSQSTSDRVKVDGWWRKWPEAAVGLDLAKSKLLVVDADRHGEADGVQAIADLMHQHQFDPNGVPVVGTPNQGTHFYFRQPPEHELGNGRGGLPIGIDIRGAGGYVIAPGSVLADGRRYEAFGSLAEAPVLPDWLLTIISGPAKHQVEARPVVVTERPSDERIRAYVDKALGEEIDAVRYAPRGGRNEQLNKSAFALGQFVGAGWIGEAEVSALLENAASELAADDGPVSVRKTISSGLKSGMRDPRKMPDSEHGEPTAEDYAASARLFSGMSSARQLVQHEDGTLTDADGVVVDIGKPITTLTPIDYPPGLVGMIAEWITRTARRPQPQISIGAALALVGAAAGRQIAGPTNAGTALYVLCLAPTSGGKDHPMKQARKIFTAASLSHHLGPDEFMSMTSVISTIQRKPLCLAPMDEFGDFMRRIYNKRSGAHERSIPKILRSAWSTNFGPFTTPEWAAKESVQIAGAHLSILGGSTHAQFYSALESGAASDGTLNRFLIIDVDKRVPEVDPSLDGNIVPEAITTGLREIYFRSGEMLAATRNQADADPAAHGKLLSLGWGAGAKEAYQAFGKFIEKRMDLEPVNADALSRASEMSIRVATIVAVGRGDKVVSAADMQFGRDVVMNSVDMMIAGANDYMADNEVHANSQKIVRLLKSRDGRCSYRDIMRSMRNMKARELQDLLKSMVEAELLERQEVKPHGPQQGGGHSITWYGLKA